MTKFNEYIEQEGSKDFQDDSNLNDTNKKDDTSNVFQFDKTNLNESTIDKLNSTKNKKRYPVIEKSNEPDLMDNVQSKWDKSINKKGVTIEP